MEPTIFRFVLFLFSEVVFIVLITVAFAIYGTFLLKSQVLKNIHSTYVGIFSSILVYAFFFLSVWILTNEPHISFFAALFFVSISLTLLIELSWQVFGDANIPWAARTIWANYEFQHVAPRFTKLTNFFSALIFFAYPAYIGIGYFGEEFNSIHWDRYVFMATIVGVLGMSWLAQLPKIMYLLASRNIQEGTRSRIFIAQLGDSVALLMIIAVFAWTIQGNGNTIRLLGDYFLFSPLIFSMMATYIIIVLVIPYVVGHNRAKHWARHLDRGITAIVESLIKGLMSPMLNKSKESLDNASQSIEMRLADLKQDKSIQLAYQVRESTDDANAVYRMALADIVNRDPRIIYHDQLTEIEELINDCKTMLDETEDKKNQQQIIKQTLDLLIHINQAQEIMDSSKPWVSIGISAVTISILMAVLSSISKLLTNNLGFISN